MLARGVARVDQVPQLGPLVARIPLAELVAQRDDALLGASLLLVAPPPAEDPVETALGDGVEQGAGLQRVASAVAALAQTAVVDVVLDRGDHQAHPEALDDGVPVGQDLREVVAGVHVQQREGDGSGPEGPDRQVQHDHGVLPAGEQQHGTTALRDGFADDGDGFSLQRVELVQRAGPRRGLASDRGAHRGRRGCERCRTYDGHNGLRGGDGREMVGVDGALTGECRTRSWRSRPSAPSGGPPREGRAGCTARSRSRGSRRPAAG